MYLKKTGYTYIYSSQNGELLYFGKEFFYIPIDKNNINYIHIDGIYDKTGNLKYIRYCIIDKKYKRNGYLFYSNKILAGKWNESELKIFNKQETIKVLSSKVF